MARQARFQSLTKLQTGEAEAQLEAQAGEHATSYLIDSMALSYTIQISLLHYVTIFYCLMYDLNLKIIG